MLDSSPEPLVLQLIRPPMDSLLANYASSDEEDEKQQPPQISSSSRTKSALFSALPTPKRSDEASSLRRTKALGESPEVSTAASLFSSLPQPKTDPDLNYNLNPKKVVQFKPPTFPLPSANPSTSDDEEEDEERDERRRKQSETVAQAPSVKSFLSSIPAPKHSAALGVSGSGRRSIVDTQVPAPTSDVIGAENESALLQDAGTGSYVNYGSSSGQTGGNYEQGTAYGTYDYGVDYNGGNHVGTDPSSGDYEGYYGQYENNWVDGSGNALPESTSTVEIPVQMPRKRGRKDIPTEIMEVKQDELMKNRPREDQVKLTGIAFGPAYQPASTKGKPSKLHKRKHQIGSLYFDMKQKETELAERRSKGLLTKAETQAKYGW